MERIVTKHLEKGDVVLITGASSDIGYEITRRFAALGCKVMAHYASSAAKLGTLEVGSVGLHQADLRQDDAAKHLVEATAERFGRIDAVINTIGPFEGGSLLEMSPASWRHIVELNLNVAFSVSHYALPFLLASKGQILNFTYAGSTNVTAWAEATAYASAKAGLAVLTKSMATALAPHGVRVNAIAPGWIDSGAFTPEKRRAIEEQVPARRPGHLVEVVDLAQWIMTASPAYMTGALVPLAGGLEF